MVFFLEITNIWQKSRDFRFADYSLETFKIHRLKKSRDFRQNYLCDFHLRVISLENYVIGSGVFRDRSGFSPLRATKGITFLILPGSLISRLVRYLR
jgi:hypothetical protein